MLRIYFCVALVALSLASGDAQNRLIDSLKTKWSDENNQQVKVAMLEELCFQFFSSTRQDSLKKYAAILQVNADELADNRYEALATFYESQSWFRSDSAKLFELSAKSIELSQRVKCQECLAQNFLGLGVKHRNLVRYDDALKSLQAGLEISDVQTTKR